VNAPGSCDLSSAATQAVTSDEIVKSGTPAPASPELTATRPPLIRLSQGDQPA